jgi:glycosyltransferase involved in cell wall biosynthesis
MIKTLVVCPLFTRSGYGEHGRFIVNALDSRPDLFDLHVHPIHWGQSSWISTTHPNVPRYEELCIKKEINKENYDLVIQVTVPNEWLNYSEHFPAPCNVGITAGIETDRIPNHWIKPANFMDHIIFTSKHSQSGFTDPYFDFTSENNNENIKRKGISTTSEVVGYPVKQIQATDLLDKIDLSTDFNFLTISQISPRKGVEDLLNWFMEEFKDENVGMVAKIHHGNNSYFDKQMLKHGVFQHIKNNHKDAKCKIHWIHGAMSEAEIHGLYLHPKINAYISTTHGEGFGLPIYEAAYSGLPVCATGWSGHLDFLKVPSENGKKMENLYERIRPEIRQIHERAVMDNLIQPHMKWAHCDPKTTKKAMRNMVTAQKAKINQAKRLQDYLKETFSEEKQFDKICQACYKTYEQKNSWNNKKNEVKIV